MGDKHCTCKLGLRVLVDCRGMECGKCHRVITMETYERERVIFVETDSRNQVDGSHNADS